MPVETFRLFLALAGLVALSIVVWGATRKAPGTAAAWACGGAVVVAVTGTFGLLNILAKM